MNEGARDRRLEESKIRERKSVLEGGFEEAGEGIDILVVGKGT